MLAAVLLSKCLLRFTTVFASSTCLRFELTLLWLWVLTTGVSGQAAAEHMLYSCEGEDL